MLDGVGVVGSPPPLSLIMRNFWASGDTSYVRPGLGTAIVGQSNNFVGLP